MKIYIVLKEIVHPDKWFIGKYSIEKVFDKIEKVKEFVKSGKEKSAPYYHCCRTVYAISEHEVV